MYAEQYCSWSSRIAYCFMSGLLRILCVRSLLLCKLFCSILTADLLTCTVNVGDGSAFRVSIFRFLPDIVGIHGARQHVCSCSARIVVLGYCNLCFMLLCAFPRILDSLRIFRLYVRMPGN